MNPYLIPGIENKNVLRQIKVAQYSTGTEPKSLERLLQITIDFCRENYMLIAEFINEDRPFTPKQRERSDITLKNVLSKSRNRELVRTRQMFAFAASRIFPNLSDSVIAQTLNRDRTTIIHSKQLISDLIQVDRKFRMTMRTYMLTLGQVEEL